MSRVPLHTLEDLRRVKLWRWDLDEVPLQMGRVMGLRQVALPLADAARAFDEGAVDGFYTIPVAALAFGFQSHAQHVLDMSVDFLSGCILFSTRSFNRLSVDSQAALRTSTAKMAVRLGSIGQLEDDALIGTILAKHGATVAVLTQETRTTFLAAARAARERLGDSLVSQEVLREIETLLADYRVVHSPW